ncbi:MAG: hypothetical protein ACPGXL_03735 [Chitinophagales bacterium]
MNTLEELQYSLSKFIYSTTDIVALNKIKSVVDDFLKPVENVVKEEEAPWQKAILSMKTITSFEDVVESQGNKKLTFNELYPYIDDTESDYTVEDLLAALN